MSEHGGRSSRQEVAIHGAVFEPIPRVIHQTWKTREVPERWRAYHESFRRHHPSWRMRLWTDEDNRRLVAERYSWFLPTYDAFPRDIQRVDAAKYLILHAEGGVYADLDCECRKPLDPLLEPGGALVGWTADGAVEVAFLASCPGHPLFEETFRQMQAPPLLARWLHRFPPLDASHVLLSTGPRMMKRAVARFLRGRPAAGLRLCPPAYFSNRSWLKRHEPFGADEAYVHHHYSDSWLRPSERWVTSWLTARRLRLLAALAAGAALALAAWALASP